MAPAPNKPRTDSPKSRRQRLREFLSRGIWEAGLGEETSLKGQWVAFLRILSISWRGLLENRLFSRAAALSYSSLIALGPLVAIVVFLSSSFVRTDAETQVKRALLFVAPSLQELITLEEVPGAGSEEERMATALDTLISQIVEGARELLSQINTAGSKTFGAMGFLILIWVVIQLLTSIETTLNQIWGVHQGRPWSQRIVFYWTFVSLGALLGLGSTALFSASNIAGMFDWVPFGSDMSTMLLNISPLLSFFMLVVLLALFYRFFPNTSVRLKPAFIGSLLTASLLFLNNYLSILYVHRVISFQSLYGSVGIIPVLMIGLYFFWVLILLGGQLTYAVQNVDFLANQAAWDRISPGARELLTLSAFLQIARRFHACEPAPTMNELSTRLHVPVNLVNEALQVLEELDWITRITIEERRSESESVGFRPARPLETYTLSRFRSAVEETGDSTIRANLQQTDPLLEKYRKAALWHEEDSFCQTPLETLLQE
ncbi:MAG: YihY/virulence factor BrkB family protein [Oceanipulchritudo sp.]